MNEELIWQASLLQKESQELENNLDFVSRELSELEQFKENIRYLDDSNNKEIIANLGKGIHVKASLQDKKLFVEVGSGVVVKKTPEETLQVIELQIKNLQEAKFQLIHQLEHYNDAFARILQEIEKQRQKNSKEKDTK